MSESRPAASTKFRLVRPYESEQAFIQGDFARIGRTSIVLAGVPSKEPGELVRFEIVLRTGAVVFRGEGPVVAYHAPGGQKPSGLEVRISRFDARAKAVLDRVHAQRVARARSAHAAKATGMSLAPGSLPPAGSLTPSASFAPPSHPPELEAFAPVEPSSGARPSAPAAHSSQVSCDNRAHPGLSSRGPVAPPPNRDEILDRLRVRARTMQASGGLVYKRAKG